MVAVQTFIAVWFRRFVHNMTAAYACVFTAWLFVVLYVAIGAGVNQKSSLYYDPTPFWCWIGNGYLAERVTGEYVWMWLALAVSGTAAIGSSFIVTKKVGRHAVGSTQALTVAQL